MGLATTLAGDFEFLTLTETGISTGPQQQFDTLTARYAGSPPHDTPQAGESGE